MNEKLTPIADGPKPNPLTMHFSLTGAGWAILDLQCAGRSYRIDSFGNMTDGLGDVVRAALALITGADYAQVIFDCEPQIWGLALEPRLADGPCRHVRVTIREGGTSQSDLPVLRWPSAPTFEATVGADDFARAAHAAASRLRENFDDVAYRATWGHPGSFEGFPLRGLAAIEAALAVREYRE
jgi:hypothetical protein